jgi:regulator of replication initiation timing
MSDEQDVTDAISYLQMYYGGEAKSKHCTAIRLCLAELAALAAENAGLKEELADGDSWQKRATAFLKSGCCPICFSTDEAGHKAGCAWGEVEAERDNIQTAIGEALDENATLRARVAELERQVEEGK